MSGLMLADIIADTMCTHLTPGFKTQISRSVAHLRWKATGPCLERERDGCHLLACEPVSSYFFFFSCARVAVILGTIFIVLPVIFLAVGYVAGVIPNPFEVCVQGGSDC